MLWSAAWCGLGLSFAAFVYLAYEHRWFGLELAQRPGYLLQDGAQALVQYLTAYLLEWSLSVDNLFVMAVIFERFRVPRERQHRVLFWGILGAIVFRLVMITSGVYLVHRFEWVLYVFGAYLLVIAVRLPFHHGGPVGGGWVERVVGRLRPIARGEHGGRFFVHEDGRLLPTTVFLALLSIELADIVFALDSVPAVLAITTELFLVVSSNVFAILGLRSLYSVLAFLIDRFTAIRWSLAGILLLVGAKMILHGLIEVPTLVSLLLILLLLAAGIVASAVQYRARPGDTSS